MKNVSNYPVAHNKLPGISEVTSKVFPAVTETPLNLFSDDILEIKSFKATISALFEKL